MTITLTFAWWWIPTGITLFMLGWWLYFAYKDLIEGGWFAGLGALILAGPAALVCAIAWALAGVFK